VPRRPRVLRDPVPSPTTTEPEVVAVLVLTGRIGPRAALGTLAAVVGQSRPPDRIVAVACAAADGRRRAGADAVLTAYEESGLVDMVVRTASNTGVAGALRSVTERLEDDPDRGDPDEDGNTWTWLLTEDAAPGREALRLQLDKIEQSPTTGVVGAKRLRPLPAQDVPAQDPADDTTAADPSADDTSIPTADDAETLVDVGLTLSHGGRLVTGVEPGELDQGQADWREDVLAVALPAMLIRMRTLARVGGLDPSLPSPWAECDLCERVWRSGQRVAVVAEARALAPRPDLPDHELLRVQRRGRLLVTAKYRPMLLALLTMFLAVPLGTVARILARIVGHSPRLALSELAAGWSAFVRTPRVLVRGARASRRARVPRRRLSALFLPRGEAVRQYLGDLATRLFITDERTRRIRRTTWGIAGTSHGADDADFGRHGVWTVILAGVALLTGLLSVRPLLGRGTLVGPLLTPTPVSPADGLAAAWSTWIPAGLGSRGPADPLVRLLGSIPVPDTGVIEFLLVLAIPLAALGAWWAAGAITRAVGARLALAVVWAAAPPLLSAISDGAWPLVLVHLLLPVLALAVGRAIGLVHKTSQASISAAAAAGLVLLVIGAVQPVLVLLVGLAIALLAPLVPGRRPRLLWVVVPSLALHLPYLPTYIAHPSTLLHVAGVPAPSDPSGGGALLALWPTDPPRWTWLEGVLGTHAAVLLPLLVLTPVALAALVAPLSAGSAGLAGRYALVLAAAGLGVVLVCRLVPTGLTTAGDLAPVAVHGLLSTVLAALSLAAGATFDALARRGGVTGAVGVVRRGLPIAAAGIVCVSCVLAVGGWTLALPGVLHASRSEHVDVPRAATDLTVSTNRARVLVLRPGSGDEDPVSAHLVVGGGDSILQHGGVLDARTIATAGEGHGSTVDADPASTALREVTGSLLGSTSDASSARLRTLAIGYVVVPADGSSQASDDGALGGALDSSPDLEKVTENSSGALWRVVEPGARAVVRPEQGTDAEAFDQVVLPSGLIDAGGTVRATQDDREVVLSERAESGWRATLDGRPLEAHTVDGWAQGFTLPAGQGGEIEIARSFPWRLPVQVLLVGVIGVSVLVALPWRARVRGRGDDAQWEAGAL
jgi:GT2 family glycosyltransferase